MGLIEDALRIADKMLNGKVAWLWERKLSKL
jgi:hypothetical protein